VRGSLSLARSRGSGRVSRSVLRPRPSHRAQPWPATRALARGGATVVPAAGRRSRSPVGRSARLPRLPRPSQSPQTWPLRSPPPPQARLLAGPADSPGRPRGHRVQAGASPDRGDLSLRSAAEHAQLSARGPRPEPQPVHRSKQPQPNQPKRPKLARGSKPGVPHTLPRASGTADAWRKSCVATGRRRRRHRPQRSSPLTVLPTCRS
jgi:hypothetical protein